MYGKEIDKVKEVEADLPGPVVAQDVHQANQAAVGLE
tara:strand:+ start:2414 stop:2524 length:111 start_codon:yes stop_codon:yes gene_type:complete